MYEEAGVTAFVMKQENGSCQNIQTVGCPKDKLPDYGFTDKPESICQYKFNQPGNNEKETDFGFWRW